MVRVLGAIAAAFLTACTIAHAQPAPGGGPPLVQAKLLASTDAIVPGEPFIVGVWFDIAPRWHIYWTNPGDSGIPTQVDWKLPPGLTSGVTRYPIPVTFKQPGDIVGFGYENQVFLTTVITPASDLKPGTMLEIAANTRWLVCEEVCIPGKANLKLSLPVGDKSLSREVERFQAVAATWPTDVEHSDVAKLTDVRFNTASSIATLRLEFAKSAETKSVEFYPGPSDAVEIRHPQIERDGNIWTLHLPVKLESGADSAKSLFGLVVWTTESGERHGVKVEVPIK